MAGNHRVFLVIAMVIKLIKVISMFILLFTVLYLFVFCGLIEESVSSPPQHIVFVFFQVV